MPSLKTTLNILLYLQISLGMTYEDIDKQRLEDMATAKVNSLSHQIIQILEHYKQSDPVGLPGVPIPDPMPIPDMKHAKSVATLILKNATVQGLSKFKIDQFFSNLANMQAEVALSYRKLEVIGNYTLATWLSRSSGGFNVSLVDVYFEGIALLEVARCGHLEASDINMDITFRDISLDFKNLGFMGAVFQGMINTIGTFVFDSIKPFILKEVNTNLRGNINTKIKSLKQTFPNSIPPLDLAIAEGRKFVRENGFDPYKVSDYNYGAGIFSVDITNIWVTGLATFYRVGNMTISITNNTFSGELHASTKRLKGRCQFEISGGGGIISRTGHSSFSVDYLEVGLKINQSLNVRKTPKLEDLQFKVGNIQLRMDGLGTLDYILEFLANILPNILRFQIVDAIEGLLKQRLQDTLDLIDVEREIYSHLKDIDDMTNSNKTETHLDPPENIFDDYFDGESYLEILS